MQSLEPRLNRVPLLRKSDNLSIREILAMTSVYELPSVQTLGKGKGGSPTGGGCVIFSWQENERFGYPRLFWRIIAWPCCGKLTAVKTGYPLTSITWPYRGLRSWLIEFACFLKLSVDKLVVFKWSQAGFNCLNAQEIKCVYERHYENFDFKLTSDAEIQTVFTNREVKGSWLCLAWSRSTSNFYLQLVKIWQVFTWKNYAASRNFFIDSWSWQSFVSSYDVFYCIFPLDVQNEIQLLSRFFCYWWLVCLLGFWFRIPPLVEVIGNSISDGIVFKNELILLHLAWCLRRFRSLRRFWPYLMAFRSCISTGKP